MAEKLFGQVKLFLEGWHAFKGPTKSPPKDYLFLVKFFQKFDFYQISAAALVDVE